MWVVLVCVSVCVGVGAWVGRVAFVRAQDSAEAFGGAIAPPRRLSLG